MRTNNLNDVMQFDHVVSILPGGNVTDGPEGIYAPELHMDSTDNGDILPEHEAQYVADALSQGWTLESGWTGQYSYSGVCMHDSEYIGGWLAEHILCTPGLWVAAPVRMLLDVEGEGWVLAYRPMVRPSGAYRCPCCGDDFMGTAYICDECDASGCEQTIDSTGEVGFWECSRDDVTESGFVATMNVPGYLPMDDEPPVFETTGEAWSYLADERERAEDETGEGEYSGTYQTLRENANNGAGIGVVYGDTPGYTGEHDLGMAYCVTATDV